MVGSSNMTSNAAKIQWNDLYGVKNYKPLYDQFLEMFNLMRKDNGFHRNQDLPDRGPVQRRPSGRSPRAVPTRRSAR